MSRVRNPPRCVAYIIVRALTSNRMEALITWTIIQTSTPQSNHRNTARCRGRWNIFCSLVYSMYIHTHGRNNWVSSKRWLMACPYTITPQCRRHHMYPSHKYKLTTYTHVKDKERCYTPTVTVVSIYCVHYLERMKKLQQLLKHTHTTPATKRQNRMRTPEHNRR